MTSSKPNALVHWGHRRREKERGKETKSYRRRRWWASRNGRRKGFAFWYRVRLKNVRFPQWGKRDAIDNLSQSETSKNDPNNWSEAFEKLEIRMTNFWFSVFEKLSLSRIIFKLLKKWAKLVNSPTIRSKNAWSWWLNLSLRMKINGNVWTSIPQKNNNICIQ